MPAGHVAVVARVLDDHTLLLDHANWGYGHGEKGRERQHIQEQATQQKRQPS